MSQELEEIARLKRELRLESDINRQILKIEVGQLQSRAADWRRGPTKFSTAYRWIVPLAGAGLGFVTARKQHTRSQRNGRPKGVGANNLGYLTVLAPLGSAILKRVYKKWRRSQRQPTES